MKTLNAVFRTVCLAALVLAVISLAGCGAKKWYWPFGSEAAKPAAAAAETVDTAADETPKADELAPEVPPVAEAPSLPDPNTIPISPSRASAPSADVTGSTPLAEVTRKPAAVASELEMVHFDYDRSDIKPEAQAVLDKNAEWLLQHPGLKIQIEGHCDERGTVEYNLTLGQKRADSVREYLVKKGVDANSLATISYGKERPLAFGDVEADHQQNRRAQFLIFSE